MDTAVRAPESTRNRVVVWRAQPGPQTALITCPVFEVFFGGARGGGKSYGIVGDWIQHNRVYGKHTGGLVVRRTRKQLADLIEKCDGVLSPIGAKWKDQDKYFRMPNGGRLDFAYLERDADAENYQGWSRTRFYGEEIGNFPDPKPLLKMMSILRSGHGIPVGWRATGNPGGPGHVWCKARYIDPAPLGWQILTERFNVMGEARDIERIFIPSKVSDNLLLAQNDPNYVLRIMQSGNEALVRAWLDGDWSVIAGAYFPEWDLSLHVVEPCELPAHWVRFRACDWGSAKPFCVLWFAVSDGSLPQFPRGAMVAYREWYGTSAKTSTEDQNVGLKLTAEQVADGIVEREKRDDEGKLIEKIDMSVMDPAAFAVSGGPSIAEKMALRKCYFHRADNKRVGTRGSMSGWDSVRGRLQGDAESDDSRPLLYFFSTCVHSIRTLPALQHDPDHPEDVDTDGEDHAPDTIRYGCAARPWVRLAKATPANPLLAVNIGAPTPNLTINQIIAARTRKRKSR